MGDFNRHGTESWFQLICKNTILKSWILSLYEINKGNKKLRTYAQLFFQKRRLRKVFTIEQKTSNITYVGTAD